MKNPRGRKFLISVNFRRGAKNPRGRKVQGRKIWGDEKSEGTKNPRDENAVNQIYTVGHSSKSGKAGRGSLVYFFPFHVHCM
jgi:hypothetical protein